MKVLLKGGPWHNRIVEVPEDRRELLVPEPPLATYIKEEEGVDPTVVDITVAKYIRMDGMSGYGHFDDVYPVWFYDGSR